MWISVKVAKLCQDQISWIQVASQAGKDARLEMVVLNNSKMWLILCAMVTLFLQIIQVF